MENEESKEKQADKIGNTVDEFERALTSSKKTNVSDSEATDFVTNEKSSVPVSNDWDNTPLPAQNSVAASEAFIIPIDETDANLKSSNKQSNTYAAKKTVAQGMMDIALITANANQLRFVIDYTSHTSTYYFNIFLITISLLFQIAIGLALIFKGRSDLRGESKFKHARRSNNFVVVGVFMVTIINVFIASFTSTGNSKNNNNNQGASINGIGTNTLAGT